MAPPGAQRDIGFGAGTASGRVPEDGCEHVVVIGIDRYHAWRRLNNAVADARGARDAFAGLGFRPAGELYNEAATKNALERLVRDDLMSLGEHDSLVIFFAGHGYTDKRPFHDGVIPNKGYLIPVDGMLPNGRSSTWVRLEYWLNEVSELPPKHILVILDSCHSGIALDSQSTHRGLGVQLSGSMQELRARRSRRVITSALGNQVALDDGPVPNHSLFTGYLIRILASLKSAGQAATATWLGDEVRRNVSEHPHSTQTPGLGTLAYHDQGELFLRGPEPSSSQRRPTTATGPDAPSPRPITGYGPGGARRVRPEIRPWPAGSRPPRLLPSPSAPAPGRSPITRGAPPMARGVDPLSRTECLLLDDVLVKTLDRHDAMRAQGGRVLSIITGDAMGALTAWGTWSASRGYLTLLTKGFRLDETLADLLAQTPWLRCLAAAREKLAAAAGIDVESVDAELDARSGRERWNWITNAAGLDRQALVSGWLLTAIRESSSVPDLHGAPIQGGELLSILCSLAAPIAVLLHNSDGDARWLEVAISTAATLVAYLPGHAVALSASREVVDQVFREGRESSALAMARQGVVHVMSAAQRFPGRPRTRTARALRDALDCDPRTRGRFELNAQIPLHKNDLEIDVDLLARGARIAVVLDGWYHFLDPQGYLTDRDNDSQLRSAGFFVMRFLAEDVDRRIEFVVDQIAIGLASRRAAGAQRGGFL